MAKSKDHSEIRGVYLVAAELSRLGYYVVPSRVVTRKTVCEKGKKFTFHSFELRNAQPYRDKWSLLGSA